MSALTIVQNSAARLGLNVPQAVFSSLSAEAIQLRALMNQSGIELGKAYGWQNMTRQHGFLTVAAYEQVDAIPTDYGWILNDSMWDRTTDRPVVGPLTPQEWQMQLAGPTFTSVVLAFRFRGNELLIIPNDASAHSVYYEYVSKNWAETAAGTAISVMTNDNDVGKIPEELITLDVIWRYKKAKGLDYAEEFRTFEKQLEKAISRDGGAKTLNLSHGLSWYRQWPNIPEGNWPGAS